MIYKRELKTKYHVDIFVAGGGPSGIAAAVSAAREGKTVFITENNGCFGGSGTAALVPSFAQFTDGKDFLVGGVGREIRDEILGRECDFKRGFYAFNVEKLKKTYDKIISAEKNIKFSFFTRLVDVEARNGYVEHVILAAKSGLFAIKAKMYIDCTGDGDLCAWAGGSFEFGNEEHICMPATLCSLWADIDFSRVDMGPSARLEEAFRDGVFSVEDRHLPGIFQTDREHGIGGGNIGHCYEVDPTDEASLTKAMLRGRSYMEEYKKYYSEYLHGYENMYLCYTADMLGIRESRRIIGDYQLTGEDFRKRAVFDDEIGRYAYPVDIHAMKPSKEAYDAFEKEYKNDMRYGVGESYGIPYRILTPEKLLNVLVAGRCVSTDRQMQASIRVMPGCYITGQAAGVAAALACEKEDTRKIDISLLQKKLAESGAYLPNRK